MTDPTEPLERVARAIDEAEMCDGDPLGVALARYIEDMFCGDEDTAETVRAKLDALLRQAARAAVEALREPTEAQIYAIKAALKTQRAGVSGMTIEAQFRAENAREFAAYYAAIDAILKEPRNG